MKYTWLYDVDLNLLEGDYKTIAEKCGLETLIKLLNEFEKSTLYFSRGLLNNAAREYIIKNKNKSPLALAKDLNLSERYVQRILSEYRREVAAKKTAKKNTSYC